MELVTINDISINPVIDNGKKYTKQTVRNWYMFQHPSMNVGILSRKGGGKTNLIYRIVERTVVKGMNVMIYASCVKFDSTYKKMIAMLKKKGANVLVNDHFVVDNVNLIQQHIKTLEEEEEKIEKENELLKEQLKNEAKNSCSNQVKNRHRNDRRVKFDKKKYKKDKEKKPKKFRPDTICIYDDLSSDLSNKWLTKSLTRNRHYGNGIMNIIAMHNVIDLHPSAIRMIDALLLLPNISEEKINEVAIKLGISFREDTKSRSKLNDLYEQAVDKKYQFLYIDVLHNEFRKNFNKKFSFDY